MKHKHRIIPGYDGGEYVEENIVELTPTQHAMWHFAEWQRKAREEDFIAWRGLAGLISHVEATVMACSLGGRKGGSIRGAQLSVTGNTPESNAKRRASMLGRKKTAEMRKNSSKGAKRRWAAPGAKDAFAKNAEAWARRLQEYDFTDRRACSIAAKELGVTYHCVRNWATRLGLRG